LLVEAIWVKVDEGAQRTGRHIDHVRRLARENIRLPEAERLLKVRKEGKAYEIWLPDLVNYIERRVPATMEQLDLSDVAQEWVSSTEAAEIFGYHRSYLSHLAMQMAETPEDEREIRIKKRPHGTEMWLPDLTVYVNKIGRGPKKRRPKDT